ncbi:MAG: hypothetical protein ACRC8S_00950 [Fimbriiglobus sp.]
MTMRTGMSWLLVIGLALSPAIGSACTFCAGGFSSQSTLREHYGNAKFVAYGKLSNPRIDPNSTKGATDFATLSVLKPFDAFQKANPLTLSKYIPVIGKTPPEYLLFASESDGKPDVLYGLTANLSITEYLSQVAKLDANNSITRLAFFFKHLDSNDPTVASDAFLEFAKASDSEITKARGQFAPEKLRKLLVDPSTPTVRLGVFAMMLGLTGHADDVKVLETLLNEKPMSQRVQENLGGYLAALVLLDHARGWKQTSAVLSDRTRAYPDRLAALGTTRFLFATRPEESRKPVLEIYAGMIQQNDIADMAIEDLRRFDLHDHTDAILKLYGQPGYTSRLIRRAIVHYAITVKTESTKTFIANLRVKEPAIVETVEELIKLNNPIKK